MSGNNPVETILDYPREVIDRAGYVHRLEPKPLGVGGQGAVFRTTERDLAVKLVIDALGRPIRDPEQRAGLCRRLEHVQSLPLPNLMIAQPLQILATPHAGYVMRLLTDMEPIRSLIAPPGSNLAQFYLGGGGLRRRLVLLGKIAEVLARLHAVPLVYADVSPNNVFISRDPGAEEVWLIDADNLDFLSHAGGPTIFTPGFGAPELAQGRSGATTFSDVYAFALLAFQVLTQQHPFLGEQAESGGGWDSEEDTEERALRGELPWIHDIDDECNRTENGIPRDLVLSASLWGKRARGSERPWGLFDRTFGPGRRDPAWRAGLLQWAEAFRQAVDMAVCCPTCGWSYYVTAKRCPMCDAGVPPIIYVQARCWDPGLDADEFDLARGTRVLGAPPPADAAAPAAPPWQAKTLWHKVIPVRKNAKDSIDRHIVAPTLFREGTDSALSVEFGQYTLSLIPLEGGPYFMVGPDRMSVPLKSMPPIRLDKLNEGWHLHCGPMDQPHRLLSFGLFGKSSG